MCVRKIFALHLAGIYRSRISCLRPHSEWNSTKLDSRRGFGVYETVLCPRYALICFFTKRRNCCHANQSLFRLGQSNRFEKEGRWMNDKYISGGICKYWVPNQLYKNALKSVGQQGDPRFSAFDFGLISLQIRFKYLEKNVCQVWEKSARGITRTSRSWSSCEN